MFAGPQLQDVLTNANVLTASSDTKVRLQAIDRLGEFLPVVHMKEVAMCSEQQLREIVACISSVLKTCIASGRTLDALDAISRVADVHHRVRCALQDGPIRALPL